MQTKISTAFNSSMRRWMTHNNRVIVIIIAKDSMAYWIVMRLWTGLDGCRRIWMEILQCWIQRVSCQPLINICWYSLGCTVRSALWWKRVWPNLKRMETKTKQWITIDSVSGSRPPTEEKYRSNLFQDNCLVCEFYDFTSGGPNTLRFIQKKLTRQLKR